MEKYSWPSGAVVPPMQTTRPWGSRQAGASRAVSVGQLGFALVSLGKDGPLAQEPGPVGLEAGGGA